MAYGVQQKLRKHTVQMTEAERVYAEALVHALENVSFRSQHLAQEMVADGITLENVRQTLKAGVIIEVNSLGRAVVRHSNGTVVVVDIRQKFVVTAWKNNPRDNHSTLRMSEYTWRVDVVNYLRTLQA